MEFDSPPLKRLGLEVGHHTDSDAKTGMTAFIMREGATVGIHLAGRSAGTFNTPIFGPTSSGETAHAVVFTGGSMYGLASVHGVLQWLEENKIGRVFGGALVPDVTGDTVFALSSLSAERVNPDVEPNTLVDIVGVGTAEAVRKAVMLTMPTTGSQAN